MSRVRGTAWRGRVAYWTGADRRRPASCQRHGVGGHEAWSSKTATDRNGVAFLLGFITDSTSEPEGIHEGMAATTTILAPGETVGGYRVLDLIGYGGMGVV